MLNQRAWLLTSELARDPDPLGLRVVELPCGTRLFDAGVEAVGSLQLGCRIAECCLAGLGQVRVVGDAAPWLNQVEVQVADPVRACLAAQYAGWPISRERFFAMGSGPMRAVRGKEKMLERLGLREAADCAVGVLETSKLPDNDLCVAIAAELGLPPDRLTLIAARTDSLVGSIQVIARSVETALHKLESLEFDVTRVVAGTGRAPLAPVAADSLSAIGRTNDAVLYGGQVQLWVRGDDASLEAVGPRIPSAASHDYGRPFTEIFQQYNGDFYQIDPLLFSPAMIALQNLDTGRTFRYGQLRPDVLEVSFFGSNSREGLE